MRKEFDFDEAFVRWGRPGEELDDEWYEAFPEIIREEGQLVAKHEWCGRYAGENVVRLFRGTYISEDEGDICGPYETFKEAADAVNFFHMTIATKKIWIHPEILASLDLASAWPTSPTTRERSDSVHPATKENSSEPDRPLSKEEQEELYRVWENVTQGINAQLRASGLTVTVKEPPKGPQPLVVTFHNPSARKRSP